MYGAGGLMAPRPIFYAPTSVSQREHVRIVQSHMGCDDYHASMSNDPHPRMTALRRILAYLADMVLVYVYIIALYFVSTAVNSVWPFHEAMGASYALRHLVGFFTLSLPMLAYFTLFEAGPRHASPGKRLLGIAVQSEEGPVTTGQALLRNGLKFLPWEIVHTHMHINPAFLFSGETIHAGWVLGVWLPCLAVVVYVAMLFLAPAGRTPYDLAARTCVARMP